MDVIQIVGLIVLTLILIILFLPLRSRYWKNINLFREIASELGLDYKEDAFFGIMGYHIKLTGGYKGRNLNVFTHAHKFSYTRIEVSHSGNFKEIVDIFPKDSQWFVKTKYRSGIPEFDRKFGVKEKYRAKFGVYKKNEVIVENILDHSIIQKILHLKKFDFVSIMPRSVTLRRRGVLMQKQRKGISLSLGAILKIYGLLVDKEYIIKEINVLVDLAERVEKISQQLPKEQILQPPIQQPPKEQTLVPPQPLVQPPIQQPSQPELPPPPPMQPPRQPQYPCPYCGQLLVFMQQYNRWYCEHCKRYI